MSRLLARHNHDPPSLFASALLRPPLTAAASRPPPAIITTASSPPSTASAPAPTLNLAAASPRHIAPRHPRPPFLPTCASAVLLVAGDRAWPLLAIAVVDAPRPTAERHAHGQWRGGAAPARSKHRCSVAGGDAARPAHRSVSGATCCGVSARR
mmetsp:Transcript_27931/g.85257  ORF Transcript_27931/g.85257 Transcript_27931/m.85257 type:complete len:154 (+) Transcript_27931:950-1411(+)